MHEQIRELSQQAFNQVWDLDSTTIGPGTHFVPDGFEQKFAELIIRECINACGSDFGTKLIKQHFGVEE